jgi:aconitate hydratase
MTGQLSEGVTATDLVLTCTQMLRARGVVGRFVEYFGPGLASLSLRPTARPLGQHGARSTARPCGFFGHRRQGPLDYLRLTGREESQIALVRGYARSRASGSIPTRPIPVFTDTLELDLASRRALARRSQAPAGQGRAARRRRPVQRRAQEPLRQARPKRCAVEGEEHDIGDGDVVIAAITSCTNTSNP